MAKTDADGNFEMKFLPEGEHEFQFWHERTGYFSKVEFKDRKVSAKGRLTLEIKNGETVKLSGKIAVEAFGE